MPNSPPYLYDVDGGRVTLIRGIPTPVRVSVSALPVGAQAVVAVGTASAQDALYAVSRSGRARRIATGKEVVPASGHAVWVKTRRAARDCVLRRVRLDGTTTAGPEAISG